MKYQETALIKEQREIAPGVYSLWLQTEHIAEEARPGQVVSVYCHDESRLLPRPISICEIDKENKALRLVYRKAGAGTAEFSGYGAGETLRLIGPLGNGFPLDKGYKKVFLIGGGIGVPPMVELSKQLPGEKIVVSGYRGGDLFLKDELSRHAELVVATDQEFACKQIDERACGSHRGRKCRNKGKCIGRHQRKWPDCGRHFRLRTWSHASGPEGLRRRAGHRLLSVPGGADGLRHRSLSGLRLQVQGCGRPHEREK